jgi:hypothetical protein
MPINIVAEQKITVGTEAFVDGAAPEGPFAAVFEDDGATGYFYALDRSVAGNSIQDAMHVYNVAAVTDRHVPSLVEIGWSLDHRKVVLLINDHPHAVFDFAARRGYCRTGFPPPAPRGAWSGHAWDDAALKLFA